MSIKRKEKAEERNAQEQEGAQENAAGRVMCERLKETKTNEKGKADKRNGRAF